MAKGCMCNSCDYKKRCIVGQSIIGHVRLFDDFDERTFTELSRHYGCTVDDMISKYMAQLSLLLEMRNRLGCRIEPEVGDEVAFVYNCKHLCGTLTKPNSRMKRLGLLSIDGADGVGYAALKEFVEVLC